MKKVTARQIKRLLRADPGPAVRPGAEERLIQRLSQKLPDAGCVRHVDFWLQVRYQLGYLSRGSFFLLGGLFAALFLICRGITQIEGSIPISTQALAYVLMLCLPPFLALVLAPALQKSLFSGMAELEAACRFSLREILLLRMLGLGVPGFLAALALSFAAPGWDASLPVMAGVSYCLYTGLALLAGSRWKQAWTCALPLVLWGVLPALLLCAQRWGTSPYIALLEKLLLALSTPGALWGQSALAAFTLFWGLKRMLNCFMRSRSDARPIYDIL